MKSDEAKETADFIDTFDKFFDVLNVSNYSSSYKALKPFKAPFRWGADKRLQWLKDEFLEWLDEWEKQTEAKNDLKIQDKKNSCSVRKHFLDFE
jgi:hypothetical protein